MCLFVILQATPQVKGPGALVAFIVMSLRILTKKPDVLEAQVVRNFGSNQLLAERALPLHMQEPKTMVILEVFNQGPFHNGSVRIGISFGAPNLRAGKASEGKKN